MKTDKGIPFDVETMLLACVPAGILRAQMANAIREYVRLAEMAEPRNAQSAAWVITAPDGRQWHGESPLRACAAAQRDTIDPVLAMQRINAVVDEENAIRDKELADAYAEGRKDASASKPSPSSAGVPLRWIPVDERLPEKGVEVLVFTQPNGLIWMDEWCVYHEDPTGMGGPTMVMGEGWRDREFEDVTHWMPLPHAPAEPDSQSRVLPRCACVVALDSTWAGCKAGTAAAPAVVEPVRDSTETDAYIDAVVQAADAHGRMRNPATQRSLDGAKIDLGRHLRHFASSSIEPELAEDAARIDALSEAARRDGWIVAKNVGSFTVHLGKCQHATRATLRAAIDAASQQPEHG